MNRLTTSYPEGQFAGLIEAATAAADAHHRNEVGNELGKRKRDTNDAYTSAAGNDVNAQFQGPAAVLFREPSEKSKKYSRPPLGKVFASLELEPEQFLQLQSTAKSWMLNDEHPNRRDVVGQKRNQNNNNDAAKLRLYSCVEAFLEDNNNGETFFGHSAASSTPNVPSRTFFWPEHRARVIKALMPLLRKMVTNERQRLYAAETRKQDAKKEESRSNSIVSGRAQTENIQDQDGHAVSRLILYS